MTGPRRLALAILLVTVPACGLFRRHHDDGTPERVDLNRASVRKIEQLPGITPSMAARIVAGRPYADAQALVERHILTSREAERIEDRIVVAEPDRQR